MDKNFMNKLDDMEMDKVSGGVNVPPVYVGLCYKNPTGFQSIRKTR